MIPERSSADGRIESFPLARLQRIYLCLLGDFNELQLEILEKTRENPIAYLARLQKFCEENDLDREDEWYAKSILALRGSKP
jgi:hypothetical protein